LRGAHLVLPPSRLGAAERGWDEQRTTTYPTLESPSERTRETLHGMPRRAGSRLGETLAEPSEARAGTNPEMGSAREGKAPSRDQNPAYARWRIGGSTRGSNAPPEERGRAAYRGKHRSREAVVGGRLNRMRIWGNAPGEAGERRTDRSPPGVSRGMVKAICPVLTGRIGKRTR